MKALVLLAGLAGWPAEGLYCPPDGSLPIGVWPGRTLAIDGQECRHAELGDGRWRSPECYGNGPGPWPDGGALDVLPDGTLRRDGLVYRRVDRGPCPR